MAMSAANIYHKNVESTAWYKEIKKIDMEVNEYFLIEDERSSGGFKHQIKHDHREIFDELENISTASNGEYQFTDAMLNLMKKQDFYACKFDGKYFDIGSQFGYLKANVEFALKRDDLKDDMKEYIENMHK